MVGDARVTSDRLDTLCWDSTNSWSGNRWGKGNTLHCGRRLGKWTRQLFNILIITNELSTSLLNIVNLSVYPLLSERMVVVKSKGPDHLQELKKKSDDLHLPTYQVVDAGLTQVSCYSRMFLVATLSFPTKKVIFSSVKLSTNQ